MVQIPAGTLQPYMPTLKLKEFGNNLWTVDSEIIIFPYHMLGLTVNVPLNVRSQVIKLNNGDIMLLGQVQYSEDLRREISAIGRVKHVVSPNALHWMWAMDWKKACPDVTVWAPPSALELMQKKVDEQAGKSLDSAFHKEVGDAGWPKEIELVKFPIVFEGQELCETVYFHKLTSTAIIIDLLFWFDLSLVKGFLLRNMISFLGIGLKGSGAMADVYGPTIKAGKKQACHEAAQRLLDLKPQQLCMSHGVLSVAPVEERLRKGLFWVGQLE